MSEQKRHTVQEMRETADSMSHGCDSELVVADADECGLHINRNKTFEVASVLRQAADAEEELRTMRSTWLTPETSKELLADCVSKTKEIDELKARLDAVVKLCERFGHTIDNLARTAKELGCEISEKSAKNDKLIVDAILRAACGDGDAVSGVEHAVNTTQEGKVSRG